jgi:bifunctional DNA-binding transcriptional regulator/antitoxin component of YhaV-PrlF toxin-antitoxin module
MAVTVTTIEVRERGVITLPAEIRRRHGVDTGDAYRLIDLDGTLILTPLTPELPEIVAAMERHLAEADASLPELLTGLAEERRRLFEAEWRPRLTALGVDVDAAVRAFAADGAAGVEPPASNPES